MKTQQNQQDSFKLRREQYFLIFIQLQLQLEQRNRIQ